MVTVWINQRYLTLKYRSRACFGLNVYAELNKISKQKLELSFDAGDFEHFLGQTISKSIKRLCGEFPFIFIWEKTLVMFSKIEADDFPS